MNKEISLQEASFFKVLCNAKSSWCTSSQLADEATVSPHTARMYARRLVDFGIVEVVKTFPGYRYRLTDNGRNEIDKEYLSRLEKAVEVFGL